MVTELNGWMLRAEKKPQRRTESEAETEFEGDQSDFPAGGSAQELDGGFGGFLGARLAQGGAAERRPRHAV